MAKTKSKAKQLSAGVSKAPNLNMYVARYQNDIYLADGSVRRAEPGFIVVADGDTLDCYPPERFVEAFPNIQIENIDIEPEPIQE